MNNPFKNSFLAFLFKDNRFSLANRLEYCVFLAVCFLAIYFFVSDFWTNLRISLPGMALAILIFFWFFRIYVKYLKLYLLAMGMSADPDKMPKKNYWLAVGITILLVAVFGIVFFNRFAQRYWETGTTPMHGLDIKVPEVASLATDQYVLLQVTADQEDLSGLNHYEDRTFSFDKDNKTLELFGFDGNDKLDQKVRSMFEKEDLSIIAIEDSETGREFQPFDKYTEFPVPVLPYHFVHYSGGMSSSVEKVGVNGELYVKHERSDEKVAEVDMRIGKEQPDGLVREVIKVEPGTTFAYTTGEGKQMKFVHLGVFPKSKIAFPDNLYGKDPAFKNAGKTVGLAENGNYNNSFISGGLEFIGDISPKDIIIGNDLAFAYKITSTIDLRDANIALEIPEDEFKVGNVKFSDNGSGLADKLRWTGNIAKGQTIEMNAVVKITAIGAKPIVAVLRVEKGNGDPYDYIQDISRLHIEEKGFFIDK